MEVNHGRDAIFSDRRRAGVLGPAGLGRRHVSAAKNRAGIEGFLLTLVLDPLGILIAAVLPTKEAPTPVVQVAAKKRYPKGHPMNYKKQAAENDDDWPDVVTWNDWKTG